jgi:hypothetical protein
LPAIDTNKTAPIRADINATKYAYIDTNKMNSVIKLNNAGVLSLTNGNKRNAADLLSNAFNILSHDMEEVDVSNLDLVQVRLPELVFHSTMPFIPVSADSISSASGETNSAFTYTKFFFFNPRVTFCPRFLCSYRAVVLFNLALIYQTSSVNPNDEHDSTALELYDRCQELLERDGIEDLTYIRTVAMNNKIQIHHRRMDLDTTETLLDKLGPVLKLTLKKQANVFEEKEVDELLLNCTCQRTLVCAPGA